MFLKLESVKHDIGKIRLKPDHLASEREKIMRMSHDEALKELIKMSKIESKIKIIKSISDSGLFGVK